MNTLSNTSYQTQFVDYDYIFNMSTIFSNESDCANDLDISIIEFHKLQYPRPELISNAISIKIIVQILVCALIIAAILVGNGAVILAVLMCQHLRTTINYYLTNLAVSSLLICGFCLWVNQIEITTKPFYTLGPFMCKFNAFIQMTCLTSSVLTLSAIACDRFVAILYPLRARYTKQRTALIIVIIWFISMIISIPFFLYRRHHIIEWHDFTESRCIETWPTPRFWHSRRKQCVTSNTYKQLYYSMVTIALFFIPVLVMVTAYSFIIKKLWTRVIPGECLPKSAQHMRQIASKQRAVKMVCLVLLVFVISWMPLQIIVLYSQFGHSSHDSGELPQWFSWLSYVSHFIAYGSSAINPIIYGGFNQNFRHAFQGILRCRFRAISRRPNCHQSFGTNMTAIKTNCNHKF